MYKDELAAEENANLIVEIRKALNVFEDTSKETLKLQTSKKACFNFLKGTCKNGIKCKYMHSNPEAKEEGKEETETISPEKKVCSNFLKRRCRYGKNCKFLHERPGKNTVNADNINPLSFKNIDESKTSSLYQKVSISFNFTFKLLNILRKACRTGNDHRWACNYASN